MRTIMKWAAVLVIPAASAADVAAQEPVHPEGATLKLILLRQKSVQEELRIGDALGKKIHDFTEKQHDAFLETRKLGEADRKRKHEEMAAQNEKFIKESLSAGQQKRLDQIAVQTAALHYLLKPDNVRAFKLTDAQTDKLKELQKEARGALERIIAAKDKEGRGEKLTKLRDDTRAKILAVLDDDQKKMARELAGPPFTGKLEFEDE